MIWVDQNHVIDWVDQNHINDLSWPETYIYIYIYTHTHAVYIRYFWQGSHQLYGHIRCINTGLANPENDKWQGVPARLQLVKPSLVQIVEPSLMQLVEPSLMLKSTARKDWSIVRPEWSTVQKWWSTVREEWSKETCTIDPAVRIQMEWAHCFAIQQQSKQGGS